MSSLVLRISIGGLPLDWTHWQEAALQYARENVAWTLGQNPRRIFGGINQALNTRSYLDIYPIVAVKGIVGKSKFDLTPALNNRELFRRDRHTCMYCLNTLPERHLTRDHIIPLSRGGLDYWTNVVTACRSCNQTKADSLLKEIGMRLNAIPFVPNYAEWLILHNRHILVDQMDFLKTRCPKDRRDKIY